MSWTPKRTLAESRSIPHSHEVSPNPFFRSGCSPRRARIGARNGDRISRRTTLPRLQEPLAFPQGVLAGRRLTVLLRHVYRVRKSTSYLRSGAQARHQSSKLAA